MCSAILTCTSFSDNILPGLKGQPHCVATKRVFNIAKRWGRRIKNWRKKSASFHVMKIVSTHHSWGKKKPIDIASSQKAWFNGKWVPLSSRDLDFHSASSSCEDINTCDKLHQVIGDLLSNCWLSPTHLVLIMEWFSIINRNYIFKVVHFPASYVNWSQSLHHQILGRFPDWKTTIWDDIMKF